MKKILVLGGGRVGTTMARDLQHDYYVVVADNNKDNLIKLREQFSLHTLELDSTNTVDLEEKVEQFDLVINALPGFLGFETLKHLIAASKNVVDISFFPENAFDLNEPAIEKDVSVVVDCGVAPGLCNLILGHHLAIESVSSYTCYVGGLPFERIKPFEYKAPFSPIDVIEEYIRPARFRINGEEVVKEALSDIEILNFRSIGELEAFNTDGLRTLLFTTDIENLKEKTLRYPGHAEKMKLFRDSGMFDTESVQIGNSIIRPIDLTSKLLFDHWKLEEGDREFTVMKILIEGQEGLAEYSIYDETDMDSKMSSMSRTTGFTATSVARLILGGEISQKGILAPENIGREEKVFTTVLNDLKSRGVQIESHFSK